MINNSIFVLLVKFQTFLEHLLSILVYSRFSSTFYPFMCVFLIFFDQDSKSCLGDYNSDITSVPSMTTQTTDESSSSHTAGNRCEATFESSKLCKLFL